MTDKHFAVCTINGIVVNVPISKETYIRGLGLLKLTGRDGSDFQALCKEAFRPVLEKGEQATAQHFDDYISYQLSQLV